MLSARSPRFPALYDEESRVLFDLGSAKVTEAQAELLALRPVEDGILIGEFDEEGRPVNEQPAPDWASARSEGEPGNDEPEPSDATTVAPEKKPRSK